MVLCGECIHMNLFQDKNFVDNKHSVFQGLSQYGYEISVLEVTDWLITKIVNFSIPCTRRSKIVHIEAITSLLWIVNMLTSV